MNTASVQCITVEVLPSQVIEVDCEVRAIPAGDLAALENIRLSAQASANRARGHATSAQLYSMESGASASSAHESRMKADAFAAQALASSLDSGENADLATASAKLSEAILAEVTTMHGDVEEAWGSIDHATLVSISADLVRTQAMIVSFHGFK